MHKKSQQRKLLVGNKQEGNATLEKIERWTKTTLLQDNINTNTMYHENKWEK